MLPMSVTLICSTTLNLTMDSKWKRGVELACVKLLVEINLVENIHLPYAIPYMNYVLSWKDHLPIKTVIIGQNPYPQNIYPMFGAALSYDPDLVSYPPRSVRALAEDLYTYNKTPMSQTVECIRNAWHLINNGTIMINETVFSMIYPSIKTNCGPNKEMEAQCIALQSVFIASYFMGQEEFTIVGMGENAALMMDQLKKWCPSDAIKMRTINCRNPAARERGDLPSRAFTLNHTAASKVVSTEVVWYHTMSRAQTNHKNRRLEQTQRSLEESFNNLNASKNSAKTELEALNERMKEMGTDPGFTPYFEKLDGPLTNARKSIIGYTNAIKSHQMQFIQYVAAATSRLENNTAPSETASNASYRNIAKLAAVNPPRKKIPMESEPISSLPVPNITKELDETPIKKVKDKSVKKKIPVEISEGVDVEATPSVSHAVASSIAETPSRKKKSLKNVTPEETVHVTAFANWFKNNLQQDLVYAGILQTVASDKVVGDTAIATKVVKHIRSRKKEDPAYDAHTELEDSQSTSYMWSVELKKELLGNS